MKFMKTQHDLCSWRIIMCTWNKLFPWLLRQDFVFVVLILQALIGSSLVRAAVAVSLWSQQCVYNMCVLVPVTQSRVKSPAPHQCNHDTLPYLLSSSRPTESSHSLWILHICLSHFFTSIFQFSPLLLCGLHLQLWAPPCASLSAETGPDLRQLLRRIKSGF